MSPGLAVSMHGVVIGHPDFLGRGLPAPAAMRPSVRRTVREASHGSRSSLPVYLFFASKNNRKTIILIRVWSLHTYDAAITGVDHFGRRHRRS
jgi:hypothetical protein